MNFFSVKNFLPYSLLIALSAFFFSFYPNIGEVFMTEALKGTGVVLMGTVMTLLVFSQFLFTHRRVKISKELMLAVASLFISLVFTWFFSGGSFVSLAGYGIESNTILAFLGGIALAFTTAVVTAKDSQFNLFVSSVLLLCGTLVSVSVVCLLLGLEFGPVSVFGTTSGFLAVVSLTILLSVYYLESRSVSLLLQVLLTTFLFLSVYAFSQLADTGWSLILVLGPVLLLAFTRSHGIPFLKEEQPLPLWSVGASVALLLLFIFSPGRGMTTESYLLTEVAPNHSDTYVTVARSASSDVRHLLFGSGPGTFGQVWNLHHPEAVSQSPQWNVSYLYGSSFLLTTLAESGLVGVSALASVFFVLLLSHVRRSRINEVFTYSSTESLCVSVLLWSLLLFIVLAPASLVAGLFFLIVGALCGYWSHVTVVPVQRSWFGNIRLVGLIFLMLLIGIISVANWNSVVLYQKSTQVLAESNDIGTAHTLVEEAIGSYPKALYYRALSQLQQQQIDLLLNKEGEVTAEDRTALQILTTLAIANAKTATEKEPTGYLNWIVLGNVYAKLALIGANDAVAEGMVAYNRAFTLAPFNPLTYFVRAELYYISGDVDSTLKQLELLEVYRVKYEPAEVLYERILSDSDTKN